MDRPSLSPCGGTARQEDRVSFPQAGYPRGQQEEGLRQVISFPLQVGDF